MRRRERSQSSNRLGLALGTLVALGLLAAYAEPYAQSLPPEGTQGAAPAVKASVTPNPTFTDRSVTLVLETTGEGRPDLRPLERDFEVLEASPNIEINMRQNRSTVRTRWKVELIPKRAGQLTVPAIAIGQSRSAPLALEVKQAVAKADPERDLYIETEIEPADVVYVDAQARLTFRFYRAVELGSGRFAAINSPHAEIRSLGKPKAYTTQRGQRSFQVLEYRYAVFPRRPGLLEIPRIVFSGEVLEREAGVRHGLFSQGKPVRVMSDPMRLTVKAHPPGATPNSWFPAREVLLSEEWSTSPNALTVGVPTSRTVVVQATGAHEAQLPSLTFDANPQVRIYPNQPRVENMGERDGWARAAATYTMALVPGTTGTLELPPITVNWWNTVEDRLTSTILPATVLQVGAAPDASQTLLTQAVPPEPSSPFWPAISGFLLTVWLLTALGWLRQYQLQRRAAHPATSHQSRYGHPDSERAVRQACERNDATAVRHALLAWAAKRWPNHPPRSLIGVSNRLSGREGEALAVALGDLDRSSYADSGPWKGGDGLARAFLRWVKAQPRKSKSAAQGNPDNEEPSLPTLYPGL